MSEQTIYVIYNGEFEWWAMTRRSKQTKATYQNVVDSFIQLLSQEKKIHLSAMSLTVCLGKEDLPMPELVKDLQSNLPDNYDQIDVLIKRNDYQPSQEKSLFDLKGNDHYIKVGNYYVGEKDYRNAVGFFMCADFHGFIEFLEFLTTLKAWSTMCHYLERIPIFYSNNAYALTLGGFCLIKLGLEDDARQTFLRAEQIENRADTKIGLSEIALNSDNIELAYKYLLEALSIDTESPRVIKYAVKFFVNVQRYQKAVSIGLRSVKAYKCLARVCRTQKGALAFTSEIYKLPFDPTAICQICVAVYNRGAVDPALDILQHYFYESNCDFSITITYLWLLIGQNKYKIVIDCANTFFEVYGDYNFNGLKIPEFRNIFSKIIRKATTEYKPSKITEQNNKNMQSSALVCLVLFACSLFLDQNPTEFIVLKAKLEKHVAMRALLYPPYNYIKKLFEYCSHQSAKVCDINASSKVLVLGDEEAIHSNYIRSDPRSKNSIIFESCPIMGLSILDLAKDAKNGRKTAFFQALGKVDNYEGLLLVLGNNDAIRIIPKMVREYKYTSVQTCIKKVAQTYAELLETINEMHLKVKISVHSVFPFNKTTFPISKRLNEEIAELIPNGIRFLNMMPDNEKSILMCDGLPQNLYYEALKLQYLKGI